MKNIIIGKNSKQEFSKVSGRFNPSLLLVITILLILAILFVIVGCKDKNENQNGQGTTVESIELVGDTIYAEEYYVGDEFPTGQKITVKFSDGRIEDIAVTSDMVSGFDTDIEGEKTVRITYGDRFYEFRLNVYKAIKSIHIDTSLIKKDFYVNEILIFSIYNIIVTHTDDSQKFIQLRENMIVGFKNDMAGYFAFQIKYRSMAENISYKVRGEFELDDFKMDFNFETNTYSVEEYIGNSEDVTIPNLINGYKIGFIAPRIFGDKIHNIKNLTIPFFGATPNDDKGFKYLYDEDVYNNLQNEEIYKLFGSSLSLTISSGYITQIPDSAFLGNVFVRSIVIPEGVTVIKSQAFLSTLIKDIKLPSTLLKIEMGAFAYNFALKYLEIPSSVVELGDNAFYGSSVVIRVSDTPIPSIEENSLDGVVGVIIPVDSYGAYTTDASWNKYSTVYMKSTDVSMVNNQYVVYNKGEENLLIAYVGDLSISEIIIPPYITEIGAGAFQGQLALRSVVLNEGLEKIGESAFQYTYLSTITLPNTLKEIGSYALNLLNIQKLVIPSSVTKLENYFCNQGVLEFKSNTPANYSQLDIDFENIKMIIVPDDLVDSYKSEWPGVSDKIFTKAESQKEFVISNDVLYYYNGNGGNVVIPDGVVKISNFAFSSTSSHFSSLKERNDILSLVIPSSVEIIADYAFCGNVGLKSITIQTGSNLESIGEGAFWGCYNLETFTLPDDSKLKTIGIVAFYKCTKLKQFNFVDNIKEIGAKAFKETGLTSVVFKASSMIVDIGNQAFASCTELKTVVLPNSLLRLENKIFQWSTKITKIQLRSSQTNNINFADDWNLKTKTEVHTVEYNYIDQ
ncbi:MAG: leucine-rich repeat domain-containing protein [Christensenellaceae bacterium]|nr:leucine-rich repeat domain-containing protein [Christensenellaceae bacterium]